MPQRDLVQSSCKDPCNLALRSQKKAAQELPASYIAQHLPRTSYRALANTSSGGPSKQKQALKRLMRALCPGSLRSFRLFCHVLTALWIRGPCFLIHTVLGQLANGFKNMKPSKKLIVLSRSVGVQLSGVPLANRLRLNDQKQADTSSRTNRHLLRRSDPRSCGLGVNIREWSPFPLKVLGWIGNRKSNGNPATCGGSQLRVPVLAKKATNHTDHQQIHQPTSTPNGRLEPYIYIYMCSNAGGGKNQGINE